MVSDEKSHKALASNASVEENQNGSYDCFVTSTCIPYLHAQLSQLIKTNANNVQLVAGNLT